MEENNITPVPENTGTDSIIIKRRIKKGYGWAGGAMLIQLAIIMVVSYICSALYMPVFMKEYFAGADTSSLTPEQIQEMVAALQGNSRFLITVNALGYLIGNISAFFICVSALKCFRAGSVFGKSRLGGDQIALGALGVLGLQSISIIVQNLMSAITGVSGVNDTATSMMTFDGDAFKTAVMLVYFVIIAPVTEEMLLRGFVLNALSPVDTTFGLIASSVIFGIMHGNFNQIFNGFLIGLLLGYIALKSGSVIPSVICHVAANANAMLLSYVYEYRLGQSISPDTLKIIEIIHVVILLIAGIAALVIFLRKNGRITQSDRVTTEYIAEGSEYASMKWNVLLKSPAFWIFTAFYIISAIGMISVPA